MEWTLGMTVLLQGARFLTMDAWPPPQLGYTAKLKQAARAGAGTLGVHRLLLCPASLLNSVVSTRRTMTGQGGHLMGKQGPEG